MAAFFILPVLFSQAPPPPPYRRVDTVLVERARSSLIVRDTIYLAYLGKCVAYNLKTLKPKWTAHLPSKKETADCIAVSNGQLLVSSSPEVWKDPAHLTVFDVATGKRLWSIPRTGMASEIATDANTIYTGLKAGTVSAIDRATRKIKWTTPFPLSKESATTGEVEAALAVSGRVVANVGDITYCLDATNGKRLWEQPASYMFDITFVAANGVVWIPAGEGAVGRDLKTGQVLWKDDNIGFSEFGTTYGGLFVGLDNNVIAGRVPRTGQIVWSFQLGPSGWSGGKQYGCVVGTKLFVSGMKDAAIYDEKGKPLWTGGADSALPGPCWTDGKALLAFDGSRFMRYVHGQSDAEPKGEKDRSALAAQMVSQFDKLDDADLKRLVALGDDAFPALFRAYMATCAAHDSAPKGSDTYPLYSKFHDIGEVLAKVASAKRSKQLLEVLKSAKPDASCKPLLMTLLARDGTANDVVPLFLKELQGYETPSFEMYESNTYVARSYIVGSNHPAAVEFMLRQLRNPKADDTLRTEAYWNLARTGGEEGLQAVLKERSSRKVLRTLEQRMELGTMQPASAKSRSYATLLDEKKDSGGRTWGLVRCGVLGSRGDLWIAEKTGTGWTRPYFLGVSLDGPSRWAKPAPPEPTIAGKKASELESGAWFALIANHEIKEDADGDGLTNLAERRLGTNPNNRDTDGDGDVDGIDPWPNVAPRALSDEEQILDAVYEARYHFNDSVSPGVFFGAAGMKPFEMTGRPGPKVWIPADRTAWSSELERCYEQGVAFIRFHGDRERKTEGGTWQDQWLSWNLDKTAATVSISTYFGGLNGTGYTATVKKFGDKWVVVRMAMSYVS